jgi:hypothetical protein
MTEQASLHLGLALRQDPAALGQSGHPDLELLMPLDHALAALGQGPPRRGRLFDLGERLNEPLPLRLHRRQALPGLDEGPPGRSELLGQAAHLLQRPLGVGGRRAAG